MPEGETTCVKKYNYSDTYDRPPFIQQVTIPKVNVCGNIMYNLNGSVRYTKENSDQTVPNIPFLHKNGLNVNSYPFEWFDLFMPMKRKRQMNPNIVTMEQLTTWSNTKTVLHNAGGGGVKYENFQMFTVDKIMSSMHSTCTMVYHPCHK